MVRAFTSRILDLCVHNEYETSLNKTLKFHPHGWQTMVSLMKLEILQGLLKVQIFSPHFNIMYTKKFCLKITNIKIYTTSEFPHFYGVDLFDSIVYSC